MPRLTQEHDAYRWICGGVQVNYHPLADFRVGHGEALDDLLTDSVASLMAMEMDLEGNPIRVAIHCYGCTAGAGSSCGGALS